GVPDAAAIAELERPRRKPPQRGKAGGRTKGQTVWFTEAEKVVLTTRAQAAGLSFASYLRGAALGSAGPRARQRSTFDRELLAAATAELRRVGNNVNQIARSLNRGRDAEAVAETMAELVAVLTLIREARQG
ncbi:plasmid mobilization protein, partial [Roseomonas mucosa]